MNVCPNLVFRTLNLEVDCVLNWTFFSLQHFRFSFLCLQVQGLVTPFASAIVHACTFTLSPIELLKMANARNKTIRNCMDSKCTRFSKYQAFFSCCFGR